MILPKDVVEMRRGSSHCLETNHVVYGIFDVIRQNISASYPQDITV